MNPLFKRWCEANHELDKKLNAYIQKRQLGADTLLAYSAATTVLATIGLAGFVWREVSLVRGFALMLAFFVGPAVFCVGLRDLFKFGWNGKYFTALVCALATMALVGLAFHEVLSVTPFFRRF